MTIMLKLLPFLALLINLVIFGQGDAIRLPQPSGIYPVGSMVYEWTDVSRETRLSAHSGDKRTLVVQIWYPAKTDSTATHTPYAPLYDSYPIVETNSYLRPAFADGADAKLILIAPGRGTQRFAYTTIAEELASHGYVVAAVDMPEIGYVRYTDGLVVRASEQFRPPRGMMGGPYEKVDQFFEVPAQMGYEDLEFAYAQIVVLTEADVNNRFTGMINASEVGVFGHSLGGRIAGKFAVENPNVKAYISMEGIPPRDIRYGGKMKMPVALLCSSGTWPYARENYFSLIDNRSQPVYMLELETFGHNSVTDHPFLFPDRFTYTIDPDLGLHISRKIVLDYFDSIFKSNNGFEQNLSRIEQVKLSVYE